MFCDITGAKMQEDAETLRNYLGAAEAARKALEERLNAAGKGFSAMLTVCWPCSFRDFIDQ